MFESLSSERALAGGAAAYLRKPVDDQALLEAIDQAVNPAGAQGGAVSEPTSH